jgi:cardiolipin synthase
MLFALKVAAARGVRVRIHTNGPKAEAFILYHAQRSYYRELLLAGIELFETVSDYNHAKLIVVDGETVVVGSMNLDMRSAHLNFELGAVVLRSHVAGSAMAMLEDRRRLSRRIGFDDLPKAAPVRLLDGFCRLASPLL